MPIGVGRDGGRFFMIIHDKNLERHWTRPQVVFVEKWKNLMSIRCGCHEHLSERTGIFTGVNSSLERGQASFALKLPGQ
jgi:hypothetical protein